MRFVLVSFGVTVIFALWALLSDRGRNLNRHGAEPEALLTAFCYVFERVCVGYWHLIVEAAQTIELRAVRRYEAAAMVRARSMAGVTGDIEVRAQERIEAVQAAELEIRGKLDAVTAQEVAAVRAVTETDGRRTVPH